jgi:hypothetical protein
MNYEEAQEVSSSGIWEKVCAELDAWINLELGRLRNCSLEQVAGIQQTIRDYEKVKQLPQIVKDRLE